jgi:hypothetical protein
MHRFTGVHDAARMIEAWEDDNNDHGSQSSIDDLTPVLFAEIYGVGETPVGAG